VTPNPASDVCYLPPTMEARLAGAGPAELLVRGDGDIFTYPRQRIVPARVRSLINFATARAELLISSRSMCSCAAISVRAVQPRQCDRLFMKDGEFASIIRDVNHGAARAIMELSPQPVIYPFVSSGCLSVSMSSPMGAPPLAFGPQRRLNRVRRQATDRT
jgi:hypothetical protein